MKTRILSACLALFTVTFQGMAQKYLNVYQDNVVIKRIPSSDIDSIRVTDSTPRTVEMWRNGSVFLSYAAEEIDSIKVARVDEPMSYIGIVGFNDELYKKDIDVLATSTSSQYKSFVNSLPQKDGTLLYYAVDNALDMQENYDFKTPLKSVNFITFTDGLDLGSTMMSDTYWTTRDYLNAMSSRIRETQIQELPINAYTVGLRGQDVTDVEMFRKNLVSLASTEENAFEVNSIYDLRSRLQDIANRIISISNRQTVSVKVPGIDHGSRMRFIFDGQSVENSQFYIEGTFSMQDRSLHDVTYHGMRARSGSLVQGTQSGIFLIFTFTGLQRLDGNGLIPMNYITHYYRMPSSSTWQKNSEFQPDNNTQRTVTYTGTSIFLVLDCSSSLGGDFSRMKSYANEFIDMVAGNALPVFVDTPQNVRASLDESRKSINVTWDAVKYAEYYKVYRINTSTGTFTLVADNVTTNAWTDESAGYGPRYYKVCAVGHGLTSEMSEASEKVFIHNENSTTITVNGVSFVMIKVGAGTFQMGSATGGRNQRPVHQVTLTKDYYIGETEVTQELWKAVMGNNPSSFKGSDQLPVERVSWYDCQTFITKLNELTGKTFRLPTEAEWEFAARGGNASQGYTYSGSNTVGDVAWYGSNGSSKTHEVATKAPNELGIYDMSGNVWEWCQDWWSYYSSSAQTNPTGPTSGSGRVLRGGSWCSSNGYCFVVFRYADAPVNGNYIFGLRLTL